VAVGARSGDWRQQALTPPATIFALSSGSPPAGIAVVRISGPDAGAALERLTMKPLPAPRTARLATLTGNDGAVLDRGLVLWFPGPKSATGEDVAELHLHGGRAVVAAVMTALSLMAGLRAAEPGEFTRRAFENGRLDLAEAEALGDLLSAETEAQRRNAMLQLNGGLADKINAWLDALVMLAAQTEAVLDFSDEDDVGEGDLAALQRAIRSLGDLISADLAEPPAERIRDGVRVVIAGAPNAGKSSLLNALTGRATAIVTPVAGTTRDVIEAPVVIDGIAFVLTDTAGLRNDATDEAEAQGIARARHEIEIADLVISLDETIAVSGPRIAISAKSDVVAPRADTLAVSALTGDGLAALRRLIVSEARMILPPPDRVALNARHREALSDAVEALVAAARSDDVLVIAEELRRARLAAARVIGGGDVEAVLDGIFSRFCIGK
jgi:tRNA modification GTPase